MHLRLNNQKGMHLDNSIHPNFISRWNNNLNSSWCSMGGGEDEIRFGEMEKQESLPLTIL